VRRTGGPFILHLKELAGSEGGEGYLSAADERIQSQLTVAA